MGMFAPWQGESVCNVEFDSCNSFSGDLVILFWWNKVLIPGMLVQLNKCGAGGGADHGSPTLLC